MPPQNIHLFSSTSCMHKQHTFSKTCTHLESQKHTTVEKGVVISRSSSFMLLPLLDDSGVLSLVCSLCPPCSAVTGVRGRLLPSSASDSSRAKLKKSKLAGSRWDPGWRETNTIYMCTKKGDKYNLYVYQKGLSLLLQLAESRWDPGWRQTNDKYSLHVYQK